MAPSVKYLRITYLLGFSILGGSLNGAAAALILTPVAGLFGAVAGAAVGLFVSPVVVVTLYRKSLWLGMLMVFVPSIITAVISGRSENPGVTLLSVVVFCAMAVVAYLILPDLPGRDVDGRCATCDYDMSGLRRCPECGEDARSTIQQPNSLHALRSAAALGVCVLGVVVPLSLACYLSYERHRSRTAAEWIERLGDNDMQIQWEARQALAQQGSRPLIAAMSHPNPGVRRNAAWALETVKDPGARAVLTKALQDSDPSVREHAAAALKALND